MKRIILLTLILITFVIVHGVEAKAQTPKRIQFSKGKNSDTVKGNTGSYGVTYIVKAGFGQICRIYRQICTQEGG